ncbi:MAG: CotH kinase family protein [Bacteroidetes bacterium]|nr:CotH kinase family protein [Bacteroidota bacterium]
MVVFRKKYGISELNFPLIPEKPGISTYKSFNLRNAGTDYGHTRIRDGFLQRVMIKENVGIMGYEPALVFLNGEYWGEYQIREKQDERYIESNYGIPTDKVDILTHKGSLRILAGSNTSFYKMYDYVMDTDAKSTDFYTNVGKMLDMENFADYFIAEIYFNNKDWIKPTGGVNNIKLWNSQLPGGKWNYLLWDMDMSCGLYNGSPSTNNLSAIMHPDNGNIHTDLFGKILKNPEFRDYYVNRFADLINTVFQYDSLTKIAYPMRDSISSSMQRHQEKWGGSLDLWNTAIDKMMGWAFNRNDHIRAHIESEFGLTKQVEITLATSPPEAGRIMINSITPKSNPWTGIYYDGVPVTISAIPNPGFTFKNWGINNNVINEDSNESIKLNITSSDIFTAYYTGSAIEPKVTFSEINYHSALQNDAGDWVEVHNYDNISINLSGWHLKDSGTDLFKIPFGTIIPPNGYVVFSSDTQKFKNQHPFVSNFVGQLPFNLSNYGEQISLLDYDYKQVLSVTYSNKYLWPREADGRGFTLELLNLRNSLDLGTNWFAGCPGGSPGYAYNLKCRTNIKEDEAQNSLQVKIFPNPSEDIIKIKILSFEGNLSDIYFSLYDFTGNEIKKISSLNIDEIIISRAEFPPGIYFVKIGNEKYFIGEKIIFH